MMQQIRHSRPKMKKKHLNYVWRIFLFQASFFVDPP